jgi:hypothetical protein
MIQANKEMPDFDLDQKEKPTWVCLEAAPKD